MCLRKSTKSLQAFVRIQGLPVTPQPNTMETPLWAIAAEVMGAPFASSS